MQYGNLIPTIYPTGVFIQSIEQTKTSTEAGGKNIIIVTLTNHTQQCFEILNGVKGDTGDAASIKEITASIDNGVGTPSVTVTSTGAGAEKTVHFDFKNLKGEKGSIALTEEVKQHITQSIAAANQHADTGDDNTLKSAKSYTDQKVQTEAQASVQGDVNVLNSAKSHTDQRVQAEAQARTKGDADVLNSAKSYVDAKITIKQCSVKDNSGYIKWSNGILLQWVKAAAPVPPTDGKTSHTYTFPLAFSTVPAIVLDPVASVSSGAFAKIASVSKTFVSVDFVNWCLTISFFAIGT